MTEQSSALLRRDKLLRYARQAMEADNLALADALAQEIIALEPVDGVAWAIRAHLAGLMGVEEKAIEWGRLANPDVLSGFDRPKHEKVQAMLNDCGPCLDEERFLLIKSVGYDFLTELFHVLAGLLLAEISNRQPCVLWGSNTLFRRKDSDNTFPELFNGIGTELLMFLRGAPSDQIYPRKWHSAGIDNAENSAQIPPHQGGEGKMAALWLLNRPERVVVSDYLLGIAELLPWIPDDHPMAGLSMDEIVRLLIAKYLVPNWRIRDQAAEQMTRLEGRKTVAVHVQGAKNAEGQKKSETINQHYPAVIEQATAKEYLVWLVTDYQPYVDDYRTRFGDAIIRQETGPAQDDPQHYCENLLTDVLVAASCDRFIGNGAANPSCMIDFLMAGDETTKHLFLPNQHRRRFLNLYRD